jgi:hypothetical protein
MDKVNASTSQAMPLMERQRKSRGHYSSVDGALRAHRQRKLERQARIDERMSVVNSIQNQFFPGPQAAAQSQAAGPTQNFQPNFSPTPVMAEPTNLAPPIQTGVPVEVPQAKEVPFSPIEMDEIYNEASFGSIADNALGIVQKEINAPEETPMDEMPKGSYIDYTV